MRELPIRGLEPLQPLLAYLVIYLVLLIFIRLFAWPTFVAIRQRGTLSKIIRWLLLFVTRLFLFGMLFFAVLWALAELGIQSEFYDGLAGLPVLEVTLPALGLLAIPLLLLVPLLVILMSLLALLVRRRMRRRTSDG